MWTFSQRLSYYDYPFVGSNLCSILGWYMLPKNCGNRVLFLRYTGLLVDSQQGRKHQHPVQQVYKVTSKKSSSWPFQKWKIEIGENLIKIGTKDGKLWIDDLEQQAHNKKIIIDIKDLTFLLKLLLTLWMGN